MWTVALSGMAALHGRPRGGSERSKSLQRGALRGITGRLCSTKNRCTNQVAQLADQRMWPVWRPSHRARRGTAQARAESEDAQLLNPER